jgi:hypothetical protein
MSDDSSPSSTGDALENTILESPNRSNAQAAVTGPSAAAINSIPAIRVVQPTRDPSQKRSEVVPEPPVELEIAEVFARVPSDALPQVLISVRRHLTFL